MARRLINTDYLNSAGDTFTLELWDMESVAANLDHTVELAADGFQIGWDATSGDYTPVVGSVCDFTVIANETVRSAIMPTLYANNTEFNLCVLIRKGGAPWWAGMVHAEETTEVIEDGFITMSLRASDGLGMLSGFNFVDDNGDHYSGEVSVIEVLHNILKKLPYYSLYATTGAVFLKEWELMKPTKSDGLFLYTDLSGNDHGVFDYLHMKQQMFYSIPQRDQTYGSKFKNVAKYNEAQFTSCRDIVEDIMTSIGASICFGEGCFNVWDYAKNRVQNNVASETTIQYLVTSGGLLESSKVDQSNGVFLKGAYSETGSTAYLTAAGNKFKRGAVRRGQFPYRGATQKHENAGSDVIYAEAEGFTYPEGQHILKLRADSNNAFNPVTTLMTTNFPDCDAQNGNFAGFYFLGDFTEQALALAPSGNGGQVRINIAGDAIYNPASAIFGGPASLDYGYAVVLRQRVEMSNGVTTYRLSRPVRTLKYTSASTSGTPVYAGVSIYTTFDGSGSPLVTYYPKYWQGEHEWVPDTDDNYENAWLDIPIGYNDEVMETGTSVQMLQTDYPNLQFYAPPATKLVSGSDNQLHLDQTLINDSYRNFVWRHDRVYDTPPSLSTLTEMSVKEAHLIGYESTGGPNLLYDVNGNLLEPGTEQGVIYRTSISFSDTNDLGSEIPGMLQFKHSGIVVQTGDGSNAYDSTAVFLPDTPKGYEIKNLPGSRIGAAFVTGGGSTFGRYRVSNYANFNSLTSNTKIQQSYDDTVLDNTYARGVCRAYMQARGRMRERVNATLFGNYGETNDIVFPYSRLITNKLNSNTEIFAMDSVTYTMLDGEQRLEMSKAPSTAEDNISGTTADQDEGRPTRGPLGGQGGNGTNPSGDYDAFLSGKVTLVEDVTEHFDASGMTGQVSITEIQDKIDKVQTTNPITDADLGGGGGGTGLFGDIFPIFIKRF